VGAAVASLRSIPIFNRLEAGRSCGLSEVVDRLAGRAAHHDFDFHFSSDVDLSSSFLRLQKDLVV
jgi:hypothetical protein